MGIYGLKLTDGCLSHRWFRNLTACSKGRKRCCLSHRWFRNFGSISNRSVTSCLSHRWFRNI
ncbi:hypothetical protein FHQ20_01550 [Pasteurellaceae bacterium USgator41]|nr:hypothetical protein FHQ24_11910 [Pasteurellaceae bacterium UScroc31]TNG98040.1 hypothetical protein FHQ20_01550 [Pasteurellaceae bacterium USgator41]